MAEFKLGRIRFVWKNAWATATIYYQDDVVSYNGKVYICVIGHTSGSDFNTDFNLDPPKWNLFSDGQVWRDAWVPQTTYDIGNIVKYGGRLYICNLAHTSADDSTIGLESDQSKWDIYAEGVEWKGNWDTDYDYKQNDLVKYGGSLYYCNTAHLSAINRTLGLEADIGKWDIFNQGFEFRGEWTATTRYIYNDVIRFGANLWIANTYHTSQANFANDAEKWTKFVDGFQYEAEWDPFKRYQPGDIVAYGGNQYIAKTEHQGIIPITSLDDWTIFSTGLRFRGDYNDDSATQEYKIGDLVRLGGYTYRAITDNQGQQPPNATYWEQFNTGLNWKGEWIDSREYVLGDVVRFGDNSYVCIQGHISDQDDGSTLSQAEGTSPNSRPDQDIQALYWNTITIGSETSVLTTPGDIVYYSQSGPTRLPIGNYGQVLQVNPQGFPAWYDMPNADDVYYVAEHGTDQPAPVFGKSIDRPWRSIRYATQQIENGTKASNATRLLEYNRRFISREIVNWIDDQVLNASPGSIWENLIYNKEKCERDMIYLIDGFIYDLSHGGNVKSREAALRYVNEPGNFYVANQGEVTVAAIQYGLTLIEKVLKNEEATVLYQTQADDSSRQATQYLEDGLADQANAPYESVVTGGGGY